MLRSVLLNIFCFVNFVIVVESFPGGAPSEACESLSPERGHKVGSQPVEYSPFSVIQHSFSYGPGQQINVDIVPKDPNINFKGFLVQALDANTYEMIGEFMDGEGMQAMKECSAVTHIDNKPKSSANLIWIAPHDREGHVLFRATIVIKKDTYYANIVSQESPEKYVPSN